MDKETKLLQVVVDNKLGKELAQLLYDTKKEVFDELIAKSYDFNEHKLPQEEIKESMKRHLSALPKAKELNSSSKKDCFNCYFERLCPIQQDSRDACGLWQPKRSPS